MLDGMGRCTISFTMTSSKFLHRGLSRRGFADNHRRMTYFSAHTKYALVYKGVKYDTVTAEYV